MRLGILAFLGAFAGFYLGLAAYLLFNRLFRLPGSRRPKDRAFDGDTTSLSFDSDESRSHL